MSMCKHSSKSKCPWCYSTTKLKCGKKSTEAFFDDVTKRIRNKLNKKLNTMVLKRSHSDADDADVPGPSGKGEGPSVGQQTSIIKNKQARGEIYAKLKHKQKVSILTQVLLSIYLINRNFFS
jgi:hypothetical protein